MNKRNPFTIFCFLIAIITDAQPKKEYYDAEQIKIKSETNIIKGIPHGKHVEYYKNGKVSRKGYFFSGKEDSTWYFYYENDILKASENYYRGKKMDTISIILKMEIWRKKPFLKII